MQLIEKMNARAILILQVEDALKNIKLPIDRKVLHSMGEDELMPLLKSLKKSKNRNLENIEL